MYLRACKQEPSSTTWLGAGIACMRLNELDDAEEALCEANILNNSAAIVWGYLTLVCLLSSPEGNRQQEADQAFEQAVRNNINDVNLLVEIGNAYCKSASYKSAERVFQRALAVGGKEEEHVEVKKSYDHMLRLLGRSEEVI